MCRETASLEVSFDPFQDVADMIELPSEAFDGYQEGTCLYCRRPLGELKAVGYLVVGPNAACQPCLRQAHEELGPLVNKLMKESL